MYENDNGCVSNPAPGFSEPTCPVCFPPQGRHTGRPLPSPAGGAKIFHKNGARCGKLETQPEKSCKKDPGGRAAPLDRGAVVYYNEMQIWKAGTENSTPRWGFRDGMAGANPTKARREGPLERGQAMARRLPTLRGSSVYLWYKFRWNHGSFDSP